MSWFRSHLRLGTRLALFALALQLVLTFGHVHLDDLVAPLQTVAAAAGNGNAAAQPSGDNPDRLGHDFCDVCALIQLAGTAVPSLPPPLAVPIVFVWLSHAEQTDVATAVSVQHAFRARAPPLA